MQTLWYLSRATGVVSLVLLTVVLTLGIVVNRRGRVSGLPQFAVTAIHRNASLLAVVFLAVHIVTAIIDPYAPIRIVDAVVPFVSAYQPFWLGLGALTFDLMIAIVVTSLLRVRIGLRVWRAVHWAAYALWPIALIHGLKTGTDLTSGGLIYVTYGCAAVVAVAVLWRLVSSAREVPHPARTHAVLADQQAKLHAARVGTGHRPSTTIRTR